MDRTDESQQIAADVTLMARIAARDEAALRALYQAHAPLIYAICLRIVREPHDAEQILVDVFAEAWERPGRFDAGRSAPASYLALLARSRSLDHVRGERRRERHTAALADSTSADRETGETADATIVADERRRAVADALASLEPSQAEAVRLSFFDGLTHNEIAERLSRPLGTVKTQVRQGLIRMRDSLRDYWEGRKDQP